MAATPPPDPAAATGDAATVAATPTTPPVLDAPAFAPAPPAATENKETPSSLSSVTIDVKCTAAATPVIVMDGPAVAPQAAIAAVALAEPLRYHVVPTPEYEAKVTTHQKCTICDDYIYNPIQTECDHMFCELCWLNWHNKRKQQGATVTCPNCQCELKDDLPKQLKLVNKVAYRGMFASIQVRCPLYHTSGCTWTGNYSDMEDHISRSCVIHPIPCAHCLVNVPRGELATHMAACDKRPVTCQHCTTVMPFDLLANHIATICIKAPITCDAFTLPPDGEVKGCNQIFARDILKAHQRDQCIKTIVACDLLVHGCTYRGAREVMDEHDTKDALKHVRVLSKALHRMTTQATSHVGMFIFDDASNAYWITHNKIIRLSTYLSKRQWCAAVRVTDDALYVVGGIDHTRSCQRFQPSSNTWTKMADTLCVRVEHAMVTLPATGTSPSGRLMVIGGYSGGSVEMYDIATNIWSLTVPMSTTREYAAAVVFGSKVFVLGGSTSVIGSIILDTCEAYEDDVKTGIGRWSAIAPLPKERNGAAAIKVDNTILVMGGSHDGNTTTDSIVEYTPANNTWRDLGWKLPHAMQLFGAIYDEASRTIMIAGGAPNDATSTGRTVYTRTRPFAMNEWVRATVEWTDHAFGYC